MHKLVKNMRYGKNSRKDEEGFNKLRCLSVFCFGNGLGALGEFDF